MLFHLPSKNMAYNLRTLSCWTEVFCISFLLLSGPPLTQLSQQRVCGGFKRTNSFHLQVTVSLLPCPLVSQHLVRSAWLHNWEGVNSPETIFTPWGMRTMEQYPQLQAHLLRQFVHIQGLWKCLGQLLLTHRNKLSLTHILLTLLLFPATLSPCLASKCVLNHFSCV